MATATAGNAYRAIARHAEKIRNDDEHVIETMSPGDVWAQGDVGLVCLGVLPGNVEEIKKPSAQLAPGTTQGSRHCLRSLKGITLYRRQGATPLDGPMIHAPDGCAVDHPEHGNVVLPPGVYGVVYQRAYAEELRRVQD